MSMPSPVTAEPRAAFGWRERFARIQWPSEKLTIALLVVLVLVVAILTITPWPVGAFQDDAMYTVLAKSLAEGKGYRFLNLPGEPNATHFPPGYPLFLAALWKAWPSFPDNLVLFKFANAGLLALGALGAFQMARRRFRAPVPVATGVALIGTLSIVVLLVTGIVMSEPLFLAILFPALLWSEGAVESGRWRDAAVAGALLGILTLVRTIGIFAIPAAGLVLLYRRRWVSAIVLGAVAGAFLLPWQLWVGAHQGEIAPVLVGKFGSYGGWLADGYRKGGTEFALEVIRRNAVELEGMLGYYFMPVVARWPRVVVMAAVLGFALLGTKRFLRNAPVSLLFLGLYTLVVMLWPFEPARFVLAVWPLWPLLVGSGVLAAWRFTSELPGNAWSYAGRGLVAVLVVAFVAGSARYNAIGYSRKWWITVQRDAGKRAKPIVEWAARYTDSTTVLSTEDDLIVYLYANRKAVPTSTFTAEQRIRPLTDAEDVAVVKDIFAAYRPAWFIVGSKQGFRTAGTLAAGPDSMLKFIGRTPDVLIYQRTTP
jgi:hypothetical protein